MALSRRNVEPAVEQANARTLSHKTHCANSISNAFVDYGPELKKLGTVFERRNPRLALYSKALTSLLSSDVTVFPMEGFLATPSAIYAQ